MEVYILPLRLNALTQTQHQSLEQLIRGLEARGGGRIVCNGLRNTIRERAISFETVYLLYKRCNTGGRRYENAIPVSREISMLLFNRILRPSDVIFTETDS
jgi:hypothetical protein